jgi:hypothetical protein
MSEEKSNGAGWYKTGYDGMGEEEARVASMFQPPRFWMPKGKSKELVFVDDEPFTIHEHNPQIGGNWRNWLTCLKGAGDDPVCCEMMGIKSRYWVGYYTVIDCSSWEDQQGNKYQYEMMLFPARLGALKKFKRKQEDRGSLVGCMYKASRDGEKAAGIGDDFEFVREAKMDKLFEIAQFRGKKLKDLFAKARANEKEMQDLKAKFQLNFSGDTLEDGLVPFKYFEVLKPKSPQEIREILAGYSRSSSGGSSTSSGSQAEGEDSVPF